MIVRFAEHSSHRQSEQGSHRLSRVDSGRETWPGRAKETLLAIAERAGLRFRLSFACSRVSRERYGAGPGQKKQTAVSRGPKRIVFTNFLTFRAENLASTFFHFLHVKPAALSATYPLVSNSMLHAWSQGE